MNKKDDPVEQLTTWKEVPADTDFTIYNIPFGVFSTPRRTARVGAAIGNDIIDLSAMQAMGLMEDLELENNLFAQNSLNRFIGMGNDGVNRVRAFIQKLLTEEDSPLREYPSLFVKQENAVLHLPVEVNDYTDFYSSREHATNVGKLFRDPDRALLPNWLHLPVAYHGRSSSVVVSGTGFHRPKGQMLDPQKDPVFRVSSRLDFELEMAFIINRDTPLGHSIDTTTALDHVAGMVLLNDWSARDIQAWEYAPLGPFLGKNFATSISPWLITTDAVRPFLTEGPKPEIEQFPYLQYSGQANYDIDLEVSLIPEGGEENVIVKSNSKYLYWNIRQQLAHHTVNGCNVRTGDILATGTISGPQSSSCGSLLELTKGGKNPIKLKNGLKRTFLEDYDTVVMRGRAQQGSIRIGFGPLTGQVLPALG